MPRSGTTLIEQILSSHPKVFGGDEVEFIPNLISQNSNLNKINYKEVGKKYCDMMNKISNKFERTTDKLPINFLSIGFIKLILPKAKIIHCSRAAEDNCFSIFKNHFTSGKIKFAYNMDEIVQYYNLYWDLMKFWNNLLPKFIYNLKYENLINTNKKETEKLLKFCELDWNENCLKFYNNHRPIKTTSNTQVRKKIYTTSIKFWENYKNYLENHYKKLISR